MHVRINMLSTLSYIQNQYYHINERFEDTKISVYSNGAQLMTTKRNIIITAKHHLEKIVKEKKRTD